MFGQTQQSGSNTGSGFSFGTNNNTQGGSIFGKPATPSGGGAFGQGTSNFGAGQQPQQNGTFGANTATNSLFGNSNNNTANTSFGTKPAGTGMFGSATNTQPNGTTPFGQSTNNNSGGLFGNNQTSTTNNASGGLFGNPQPANTSNNATSGLFGKPAPSTSTGGGLFGNSAQQTSTTGTTGGLFGNTNAASNTATASGGLFGSGNTNTAGNTAATPSSLFGNNTATNTTTNTTKSTGGGLFGAPSNTTSASGGLFGNANNTNTTTFASTGLFGNNNAPTTSTGLFGQKPSASTTGTTGGLFGNNNNQNTTGGSLFGGNSNANNNTQGSSLFGPASTATAPATSGGLFGNAATATNTASTNNLPLIATIDKSSFELPDVAPSLKLYTSLTSKPVQQKNAGHIQEKPIVVAPPPQVLPQPKEPEAAKQPEARKLMNSYKRFLEVRPTNLTIKRARLVVNPSKVLALPKPADIAQKDLQQHQPNISIFNKVSKDVTTVTINKKALEQGYFVRPSLDDLLTYTKTQLKSVRGLIIGRSGYGQVEYPDPVDLSSISNLGDLLGTIVVFNEGTVCVYPDETKAAKQGVELNKPAVVTIENVLPRDADNNVITDNADPRVGKFVDVLKERCAAKGAEFITFTHGIWVFKVPHFSVWGITPQEMIVDDTPEKILVDDDDDDVEDQDEKKDDKMSNDDQDNHETSSSPDNDFVSAIGPEIKSQVLAPVLFAPREETPEDVDMDEPSSWHELLKDGTMLAASSSALTSSATNDAARNAIFAGSARAPSLPAVKPVASPKPRPKVRDIPISLEELQKRTTIKKRHNGLAKLATRISFNDLESIQTDSYAWSIAAMLFEPSKEIKGSLSSWLKRNSGPIPLMLDGLDIIWYLITINSLDEAIARATALGEFHLATTIACLGSKKAQHQENALKKLAYLSQSGEISRLPEVVRKIYEVASGNLGSYAAQPKAIDIMQGLDWKQRIGMHLWYGIYDENEPFGAVVKKAMVDAPEGNTELAMLKLVGDSNNLSALLSLVDEPTGFLLLQALQSSTDLMADNQALADKHYTQVASSLLEEGRASWSLFVTLHINDDTEALGLTRKVLAAYPDHTFEDSYLPKTLVNEAAAQQAHDSGKFKEEAEFLIAAQLIDRAHEVIITEVAPRAVIADTLSSIANMLDQVSSAKGFNSGAGLYRNFYKFSSAPSKALAQNISSTLANSGTSTSSLHCKAAKSIISAYIAKNAASWLTTTEVMKMPLGASYVAIQAPMRSLIDLESL